ncbi:MAG: TolC family protein [Muribaculaceae bacterium]
MKCRIISLIAAAIALTSNASADGMSHILQQIKQNNTQLKVLNANIEAQTAEIRSSNNLSDPSIDGAYLFGAGKVGDKWEIGVSQGFDWPGIYSARSKANNARIDAINRSYSKQQIEIITQAQNLCLEIICLNRRIAFEQRILANLDSLYTKSIKGLEYGEISILDTNKLKIERLSTAQSIAGNRTLLEAKIKELEALNGNIALDGVSALADYPNQTLRALPDYLEEMKAIDPELLQISSEIDADNKQVSVAKMQNLPKFSLGYRHVNEIGDHFNGVGVGVSIPVFENRGKSKAAKAQAIASQLAFDHALNNRSAEIIAQHGKAVAMGEQLKGYRDAIEKCNNIEILDKALYGGQISLINYLLELRYFIEAQNAMIDLEYEFNLVLTYLNRYSNL